MVQWSSTSKHEAYEIVKAYIEPNEGSTMEMGPRGSEDSDEDASLRAEDGAYVEAEREYDVDVGEGAVRATLSYCGEWTSMDEGRDYRDGVATDNDVRKEVSTDTMSGGASPRADVRPRVTDGGCGKAGNRNEEEEEVSVIGSNNEEGVRIRPNRKTTRSMIRLD